MSRRRRVVADHVEATPRHPTRSTPAGGAGGVAAAMVRLQGQAGNRALTRALQRAGPAPEALTPDAPLVGAELGVTNVTGRTMPQFQPNRDGTLAPTTAGRVEIDARAVGVGVYERSPRSDGTPRRLFVGEDVAPLVRQGEQEHSDDFWWGHQLVAGEVARAINVLAGRAASMATGMVAIHRYWRAALHAELSPKLRVSAEDSDPRAGGSVTGPWMAALSALHQASLDRDTARWHSMASRRATATELRDHPVPQGTELSVAVPGGQIGRHGARELMAAAFAALPDRP